jgi:hypothetical protein
VGQGNVVIELHGHGALPIAPLRSRRSVRTACRIARSAQPAGLGGDERRAGRQTGRSGASRNEPPDQAGRGSRHRAGRRGNPPGAALSYNRAPAPIWRRGSAVST